MEKFKAFTKYKTFLICFLKLYKHILTLILFVICSGTSSSVSFDFMPQVGIDEMVGGQAAVLPTYDETALCSGAFRVLRSMVNAWIRDVSLHRNVFADFQIVHFYRSDLLRKYREFRNDSAIFQDMVQNKEKIHMNMCPEMRCFSTSRHFFVLSQEQVARLH